MAVKPQQLQEEFQKSIDFYEQRIDERLMRMKGRTGKSFTIDVPPGMTSEMWSFLQARYLEAGWKEVKWESYQRDGDFLRFTA